MSFKFIRMMGKDIGTALAFLSKLNVVHRDLKPENILLKNPEECSLKIIDFGLAVQNTGYFILNNNKSYKMDLL